MTKREEKEKKKRLLRRTKRATDDHAHKHIRIKKASYTLAHLLITAAAFRIIIYDEFNQYRSDKKPPR